MSTRRFLPFAASAAVVLLLAAGCSSGSSAASDPTTTSTGVAASAGQYGAGEGKPTSSPVLDKQSRTVLDQLLAYPGASQAQVSAAVLTFPPGARTGMHRHDAPLFVYVLEGTITVTYDGGVVKEFSVGSALLEAIGTAHEGRNLTDAPVKLLAVNMGAEGVANTVTL